MKPKILTKEILDNLREIDGFPIGKDEDIIRLSNPPFYTACPNPWINDFIERFGKPYNEENDTYNKYPYSLDITEGRSGTIYNTHSYHTKVPHKAIMRYILHYTDPKSLIFDGFCGSGMTGIAAQLCGDKETIEELGYKVDNMGNIYNFQNQKISKMGYRYTVLNDLSPNATFISFNYNNCKNVGDFQEIANAILNDVETEFRWVYETNHITKRKMKNNLLNTKNEQVKGIINYIIWSEIFICSSCQKEMIFWEVGLNENKNKILPQFLCPYCNTKLEKKNLERAQETVYDEVIMKSIKERKTVPVLINYSIEEIGLKGKKRIFRFEKTPDENDLEILKKIDDLNIPYWFPKDTFMFKGENWGDSWRKGYHQGITNVYHFYTKRNLLILSAIWNRIKEIEVSNNLKLSLFFFISSYNLTHSTKMSRIIFKGKKPILTSNQSGTLYFSSLPVEKNIIIGLRRSKIKNMINSFKKIKHNSTLITTQSSSKLLIKNNSIDYIFTDPPFGGNLLYSELNFIGEAWLKVFTNNKSEAITSKVQEKNVSDYQLLMEKCFKEFYRILKPGRWITIEFHNSKNSIWNAIQEAIQKANFIIADVRVFDKKQNTIKQILSTSAVDKDLIISAYKPKRKFEKKFISEAKNEKSVWEFVKEHLTHLPVIVEKNKKMEILGERQKYLLFDRLIAFYIQHGFRVPISSGDFYIELNEKFPERDGMYFLPYQVVEYDKKKLESKGVIQLQLFITDEKSAISWLRNELKQKDQTYQEIQPKFLQQMLSVDKYEEMPELIKILEENFLKRENDLWYIPDPNKEADLEKMRNKHLLKEFNEFFNENLKKIKKFRMEAIRAGFKDAWENNNYSKIVEFANKIPSTIIQEDSALLMYYDNAQLMIPNQE